PAALHRAQVTREEVDGQRSDNVKLLFRAERPAAFDNAVVHIVGEKDEVCPTVGLRRRAQNEGDGQDRDKEEVIERPASTVPRRICSFHSCPPMKKPLRTKKRSTPIQPLATNGNLE